MNRVLPELYRGVECLKRVTTATFIGLLCTLLVILSPTAALFGLGGSALAAPSHAPETAKAYIISPSDGQTVDETFTVKFGLSGMGVAPAGIDKDGTGHHHLLIDVDELPPLTEALAATAQIKHFGGGQTETSLSLTPGEHTLQLLLGNYSHVPHDNPVLSEKISIVVK